jgi:hypothetical protein
VAGKYARIRSTPTFLAAYAEIRGYLRRHSPAAYCALPAAMTTILEVMAEHPRAWPVKRKRLGGVEQAFHQAVKDIAYRRLHVRYVVAEDDICYLVAVWVDGQDEPRYIMEDGSAR